MFFIGDVRMGDEFCKPSPLGCGWQRIICWTNTRDTTTNWDFYTTHIFQLKFSRAGLPSAVRYIQTGAELPRRPDYGGLEVEDARHPGTLRPQVEVHPMAIL